MLVRFSALASGVRIETGLRPTSPLEVLLIDHFCHRCIWCVLFFGPKWTVICICILTWLVYANLSTLAVICIFPVFDLILQRIHFWPDDAFAKTWLIFADAHILTIFVTWVPLLN